MQKIPVAVLGATGMVGQNIVQKLINHPWFKLQKVTASKEKMHQSYAQAIKTPLFQFPKWVKELPIDSCFFHEKIPLVFSALPSEFAQEVEYYHLKQGSHVISNAKNYRMQNDVPLLIPEVNPQHLSLIEKQQTLGNIITNPNCVVAGLTLALTPIEREIGIDKMHAVTFQALSGGGFNVLNDASMNDNLIPYIDGEAEKIESEPLKILGSLTNEKIEFNSMKISAQTCRVPITKGHLISVSLQLHKKVKLERLEQIITSYSFAQNALPSSTKPLIYLQNPYFPQPKQHLNQEDGMSIFVGKITSCSCLDYKFNILVDNLERGAAGGAILNGELFTQSYLQSKTYI